MEKKHNLLLVGLQSFYLLFKQTTFTMPFTPRFAKFLLAIQADHNAFEVFLHQLSVGENDHNLTKTKLFYFS